MFRSAGRIVRGSISLQRRHNHSVEGLKGFWKKYLEYPSGQFNKLADTEVARNAGHRPSAVTKPPHLAALNFTYTIEQQCETILDNSKSLFNIAYDREKMFQKKTIEEREQLPTVINELDIMHAIFLKHDLHCAVDYFSRMFRDDAMVMQNALQLERKLIMQDSHPHTHTHDDQADELTKNAHLLSLEFAQNDDIFNIDYHSYLDFLVVQVEPSIITVAKNINTMTTILSSTLVIVKQTQDVDLGLQVLDDLIDRWNHTEPLRRQAFRVIKQGSEKSICIRKQLLKKM